jgi:hypothetical protein
MRAPDRKRESERRPEFECTVDPETGDLDERCVRDYLSRNMPLAV